MGEDDYVIMLDYLLEVYQHHWPVSAMSSNLDSIQQERQHDGNPRVMPREDLQMVYLENKSLINAIDSRVDKGGIYQLRKSPKRGSTPVSNELHQ
ncbi:MAG TPA: hypothetical protein VJ810_15300 [Blastocatellia bacterium]|nr:hypothetical protein [Blastocatellia bacterium]